MLRQLIARVPTDWRPLLERAASAPGFADLDRRIAAAFAAGPVYPRPDRVFYCFAHFGVGATKAVVVGQDPYHTPGAANGLAFGTDDARRTPPSLRNVARELKDDLGADLADATLVSWARQGVLLLNSCLTVPAGRPGAHAGLGWEGFTAHVLRLLLSRRPSVPFLCWGKKAQAVAAAVNAENAVCSAHPSPLAAKGFLGSKPFSRANAVLLAAGEIPPNW